MRRSRYLLNTLKETPKEAVVVSHQLMLRAGMIKQVASGIYTYMPFGLRSIRKIETIVRDEMDAADCVELLMPSIQPAELWTESGRWKNYGKELLRMTDRKENAFCYGPTHEEVVTDVVRREVRSYKELPLNLYQIQTKFRDEIRPRFGLMRGREFVMKDAYSFDVDDAGADQSYWKMVEVYKRIFERCGLEFRPVEADSGLIGGSYTHEFHVLAGSGEDEILSCNRCDYAANSERAEFRTAQAKPSRAVTAPEEVATPGTTSIEAVSELLSVEPKDCIKIMLFKVEDAMVAVALRGDRALNETALRNVLDVTELELVDEHEAARLGFTPGYLGPIGLPEETRLIVDPEVYSMEKAVAGANQLDMHLRGVFPSAHVPAAESVPVGQTVAGDPCPRCDSGILESWRGIEVGQVFKLGTKYSESMGATFLDESGQACPMVMGCYGIGVTRTMAASIEQNHDAHGIIWPVQIAPFHVTLLNLDPGDPDVDQSADAIYDGLGRKGVEVLYDDRDQRPGFKFKDADLLGIPLQIVIGRRALKEGRVDLKMRKLGTKQFVALAECVARTVDLLGQLGWEWQRGRA